ncbi:MAG: S8 family serine peptidase [Lachnospiraceae bacterium]|nr:S8 family serine peptidase [Lachnospiraceae bacterium]
MKKKLFALMLALLMAVSQAGATYAAEGMPVPEVPDAEEGMPVPEVPDAEEDSALQDLPQETEEYETGAEAAPETEILPFGLAGMPDSFVLSQKEIEIKQKLLEHHVPEQLEGLEPGKDYVADEVFFLCDDPEYAAQVAAAYNGTLKSCEYGVAVIRLDTEVLTVDQAVKIGADIMYSLPPVEPNYKLYLDDPAGTDPLPEPLPAEERLQATAAAVKKNAWDKKGWEDWKDRMNDPALDPDWTFNDIYNGIENNNGYQWMLDKIGVYSAWGVTMGSSDVTVAVIDTGVMMDHEDLQGKVTRKAVKPDWLDNAGHGTHVAGIIASVSNNGKGGVGVAPNVKILDLPIFGDGGADESDQIKALNYVASGDDGKPVAQVVNMSLGGPKYSYAEEESLKKTYEKGVTVCVALGNDYVNYIAYPAGYEDYVIGVTAMDMSDQKSDFSNYGSWADIAAPGSGIFSTWNGRSAKDTDRNTTGIHTDYYSCWDGTSMATPVVAGVCALYISEMGPGTTPDEVKAALKKTATKMPSPYEIGAGVVNAAAMLQLTEETTAPVISAMDASGKKVSLDALPSDGTIVLSTPSGTRGGTLGYVYTVNGKNPSAAAGEVKSGTFTESGIISIGELIGEGVKENTTLTLKALRLTGSGTSGETVRETFRIKAPESVSASSISVNGPVKLGKGKSASYKAVCRPNYLNTKVEWSLIGAPAGVTINKKTGKVSTRASSAGSFRVKAVAKDDGALTGSLTVTLVDPVQTITCEADALDQDVNIPVKDSQGRLKSFRLYNVDVRSTAGKTENRVKLNAITGNDTPVVFTSSKPSVAAVSSDGTVTARKAGTARITCASTDGSNKKVSVTVKVIVPVSGLRIYVNKGQAAVGYGKSITLRAALGTAYGKPDIKKVVWDQNTITVQKVKTDDTREDVTSRALPYVKLDSRGKITLDRKFGEELGDPDDFYLIYANASTTDGTKITGRGRVIAIKPATKAKYIGWEGPYKEDETSFIVVFFESDYGLAFKKWYGKEPGGLQPIFYSSNPKAAGGKIEWSPGQDHLNEDGTAVVYSFLVTMKKPGRATLTFKADDGTGKTAKFSSRFPLK